MLGRVLRESTSSTAVDWTNKTSHIATSNHWCLAARERRIKALPPAPWDNSGFHCPVQLPPWRADEEIRTFPIGWVRPARHKWAKLVSQPLSLDAPNSTCCSRVKEKTLTGHGVACRTRALSLEDDTRLRRLIHPLKLHFVLQVLEQTSLPGTDVWRTHQNEPGAPGWSIRVSAADSRTPETNHLLISGWSEGSM